jgi:hypothetical protein
MADGITSIALLALAAALGPRGDALIALPHAGSASPAVAWTEALPSWGSAHAEMR